MLKHNINASLQLVPLATLNEGLPIIDKAIELIIQSGLTYEVGPFGTSIEGTYSEVMLLIQQINEMTFALGCNEWLMNIQLHISGSNAVSAADKTAKHRP